MEHFGANGHCRVLWLHFGTNGCCRGLCTTCWRDSAITDVGGQRQDLVRANGLGIIQWRNSLPFRWVPAGRGTLVACDCKVGRCPPFTLAPEGRNVLMSEEGLAQKGHGSDQVQFMNAVLIPVIVDDEGQGSLRRI